MIAGEGVHLTYCSNIHPGETWPEVRRNLETFVPRVRDRVAPGKLFGIGLRLSARAADELNAGTALDELLGFLRANGLYVFTLNGFPYGPFHGVPVKSEVYRPDWRDPERLRYTNGLADLLARLLPADTAMTGSLSTVPGAFKEDVRGEGDVDAMAQNLVRHVAHLVELERRTGRIIATALEPEPCCMLETIDETVAFFRRHVFTPASARLLGSLTGLDRIEAGQALRRHLGLCLDLCHAAVEFEDLDAGLAKLADTGVNIFKVQISAGLRIDRFDADTLSALRAYEDPVYLHQVVEDGPDGLRRLVDLPEAFASLAGRAAPREWRVHFHVPVFHDDLGRFRSTRDFIAKALARQRREALSDHLEIETYTWGVLPEALRASAVDEAIAREFEWVMQELQA